MRRLLCNAIYWLIEPLLDRLDQRKALQRLEWEELTSEKQD
ncbi:hypothetical protein PS870_02042 [Pseudomonas fluorescens]|jgi:hypothetical protein|uniref:Uncharacterized protein n=1 Tax=Pseudomonas fluorescens TaxID=294 RepID=A0A5E7JRB1_PSEFL|nr:hypothetical protein [Pseudomonas fluorescens]VVO85683.1 hypothetical protein PS870_02042 [Pseudomonas fluorescens]